MNKLVPKLSSGNIELLKLIAAFLMTMDHVNKYLYNSLLSYCFELGRLSMPIFVFVLAYNLAFNSARFKVIKRLALCGTLSTPIFIALGGLKWGWYPLNIMFTLLSISLVIYAIERKYFVLTAALFLFCGAFVEYWWPSIGFGVSIYLYYKLGDMKFFFFGVISLCLLWFVNGNIYAVFGLILIYIISLLDIKVVRLKHLFYIYYPLHLAVILVIKHLMIQQGYLFFY
ncbi:TraX family protein [Zophobihabitans entericus]|uniref:Conjugal transfer protein TraX n=1 Tax=Zophobihabitans entericus TaxID=1635327 RepID=A0A6G9IE44_9GAMM|nr:TraX family protein [Zophobihabitans entericus]QIQ22511.1 conjugal transfer protein TraX [Zophobihabitans entericus]